MFVFIDEESAYAAAQSNQLDLVRIAPRWRPPCLLPSSCGCGRGVENRGIVFPIPPAGGKDAKGYPIGNDVTSDVAVRRAINYAIDRKLLADQLLEGHAIPAYSAVEGLPWQSKSIAFKDGDAAHANALLDQAGWKMGSDGIRHKGSLRAAFTLWYTSGDSTRRDLAEAVRAMLKPIGLEVSLKSGSWEQVEREMHANPVLMGWGSLDPMGSTTTTRAVPPAWSSTTRVITRIRWWMATSSRRWMPRTGRRQCRSGSRWSGMASVAPGCRGCRLGLAAQRAAHLSGEPLHRPWQGGAGNSR